MSVFFDSVEDVMVILGDDRSSTRLSARCGVDGRGVWVWVWGLELGLGGGGLKARHNSSLGVKYSLEACLYLDRFYLSSATIYPVQ